MQYDIDKLYKDIGAGQQPSLIFMYGEEEYPIDMTIGFAVEQVVFPELNSNKLSTFTVDALESAISTPPMMGTHRLIILDKADVFGVFSNDEKKIKQVFGNLPAFTKIIVHEAEVNKKLKAYKALETLAVTVASKKRSKSKLKKWIQSQLKKRNLHMDEESTALLSEIGEQRNMYELAHAVDYFDSLKEKEQGPRTINRSDIYSYFNIEPETDFFELYRLFGESGLYTYVRKMLDSGEPPLRLLYSMGNFLRNIYKYKMLKSKCEDEPAFNADVAETLGFTPFMLNKVLQKEGMFSMPRLEILMDLLEQTDMEMKSTAVPVEALVEQFTLKLIQ